MYDSKKQARVAKPLSKAPQQQRNLSGVMRGSSGTHGMRSDSRSNGPAGKPYDTTIGFQGLDQAKVNLLSSSTVAARGGHLNENYHQGSTGITGHSISPNYQGLEPDRLPPATGGSGAPSKKQRMKMLNMSKINGPAATSFYYPQSTRAGSKGSASGGSSLLANTAGPGVLSNTLKSAAGSGKALFPEDNRHSPTRTAQLNYMMPPRGLSSKFGSKIGNSSMTYSDLSGLHYRYQSPGQAAAKISSSNIANSTLNVGRSPKYHQPMADNTTQRVLQTPKSSGQRLMSGGGFNNSAKQRLPRDHQKPTSRVSSSTKNQPSQQQRQTTPFGKQREASQSRKATQASSSLESLGGLSEGKEIDSIGEYYNNKRRELNKNAGEDSWLEQKNEASGKRASSVTTASSLDAQGINNNNRLQIKIPGGNLVESDLGNGFKSFTTRNAETGEHFQFFSRTPTHQMAPTTLQVGYSQRWQPGHKISIPNYDPTKCSIRRNGIVRAYAANTNQGIIRNYNEDRVSIILNIMQPAHRAKEEWPKCSFFGVYDGHGGAACADFLRDNLHQFVIKENEFPTNPRKAIQLGFMAAENHFLALCEKDGQIVEKSGSCAVVVLIVGETCFVANVGDSRAVLSENQGAVVTSLTRDHKPNDEIERKRIEEHGGQIYQTATATPKTIGTNHALGSDPFFQKDFIIGPPRVFPGRLSVCRTFGDPEAKIPQYGGNRNVVVSTPEIVEFKLTKEHDFIVLASDGIFDKLTNEESIQCVWNSVADRKAANVHQQSGLAVEYIIKNSLVRRTLDNVTVVMIAFSNFKRCVFGKDKQEQPQRQKSAQRASSSQNQPPKHVNKTMHDYGNSLSGGGQTKGTPTRPQLSSASPGVIQSFTQAGLIKGGYAGGSPHVQVGRRDHSPSGTSITGRRTTPQRLMKTSYSGAGGDVGSRYSAGSGASLVASSTPLSRKLGNGVRNSFLYN